MSDSVTTTLRHSRVATQDEDEAREILDEVYGARLQVGASRSPNWRLSLEVIDANTFSVGDVVLPAELRFYSAEHDDVVIGTATDGLVEFERGKQVDQYLPGDVYIGAHPHGHSLSHPLEARTHTITLPQALLSDVARGDTTAPAAQWRFTGLALTAAGSGQWRQVTRLVDELLAEPATAASPILLGSAGRLLAATALTLFPNTLLRTAPKDRTDATPSTLRRAVASIEENLDLDISLADIARAACVTPRAVQLAFRRHLDTTPMAYLRHARLAHAHQELRDASHTDGITVTAVAARWGFTPSRFAEHYRAAYGVLPSQTLRS